MLWQRSEGKECKEGRVSTPGKKETRNMCGKRRAVKKLDEQKNKLQKELRDVEKLSLVSKEAQESIKESLQHQLQEEGIAKNTEYSG